MSVLIASLVAIFGVLPQVTHAIPPASLRIWFLLQQANLINNAVSYFHDPADLTSGPGGASRFEQLEDGQLPRDIGITIYNTTNTVTSGQSVALTTVVWLDEAGGATFPLTGTQPNAHILQQNIPYEVGTNTIWSSRRTNERHFPLTFSGPNEEPGNYVISGQSVEGRSGRPNLIQSTVYTAPEITDGSDSKTFGARATYTYSADISVSATTTTVEALLKVVSNQQRVEIKGGTVAVDRLDPNSNRLITDQGQTVITGSDSVPCGWVVSEIRGDCITSNPTTIGVYTGAQTTRADSWSTLTRTMSKLAQERGEFTGATGSDLSTKINDFITAPLNIWEASRGKVLFVTTPGNLTIDPGTSIELKGKKVVVFTNADSVSWQQNVVVDGSNVNSLHYKLAVIAFKDTAVIELTKDAYVGAFMSRGSVRLAGSGSTLSLFGLVIADDELTVTRSVSGTTTVIARITYDPSFQNGTVVGLSPFVRPLVSGGSDR